MINPAASQMGKLSVKKRFKGKSKKEVSQMMRDLANRRYLDKAATATPNR
jgi:hypothetical protein